MIPSHFDEKDNRKNHSGAQRTFKRIRHRAPMLRLESAHGREDVEAFDQSVRKTLGIDLPVEYVVEPKIAGVSVGLGYEKGVLKAASTAGDGNVGDEVTANIKTILTVPLNLTKPGSGKDVPEVLEVQGRVYVEKTHLERLNRLRRDRQEPPFANVQDAAENSLLQSDPRAAAKTPLNVFCVGVGLMEGVEFESHYDRMVALQSWGLRVDRPRMTVCGSVSEVWDRCLALANTRGELPYAIEGAVIKVNGIGYQRRLDREAGQSKWAIAYEF